MNKKRSYVTVRYSYINKYQHRQKTTEVGYLSKDSENGKVIKIDNNSNTYSILISDKENIRLYNSKYGKKVGKIDLISYRVWESDYELQLVLPDIDNISINSFKLFIYAKDNTEVLIVNDRSVKLETNLIDIELEYNNSEWAFNEIDKYDHNIRYFIKQKNENVQNTLTDNHELYVLSEKPFDNIHIE